jgi:hypothetical protein
MQKNSKELKRSAIYSWLATACILGALGATVGYLQAPLLKHSSWFCAAMGTFICLIFTACLFLVDQYKL